MYKFVKGQEGHYAVRLLCATIGVSRSGYYSWRKGKSYRSRTVDTEVEERILSVFRHHRRRYGVRRIRATLCSQGIEAGSYRIRRVMRKYGLKAIQPRSFIPRTTQSRHPYPISPNLLLDQGLPAGINAIWVGDITYIPLRGGNWAYLAVWMDLCSRRIVGWHLADHMREELVTEALRRALAKRSTGYHMVIHSDRGGQYAGNNFRKLLEKNNLLQSMSRSDNPYDNAFMESCFSRFKCELLEDGVFESMEDACTEIFEYIEMYYNPQRLHSSLGYVSPVDFEKRLNDPHKP